MPVRVRWYTDPACSASWAAEPKRRSLLVEFGDDLSFTYVMGGLARDYDPGYSDAETWLAQAADSRMPMDPRIWTEGPIRSSFPACIAVKAAAEQGPEAEDRYLRAVREGLMCLRRKLDNVEALVEVAREAGLDVRRFRIDAQSNAILESFADDLEETRGGDEPVVLPSARFERAGGEPAWVLGEAPYEGWRAAALAAGARSSEEPRPDPPSALRRFGRMATVEVEAVCDLSAAAAEAELSRLALEGRVRPLRVLTGTLWEPV
ncbi:MAG TPA: DsbA family protein [Thermoleophilaceae bacterium]|nr:DsbA family protein [Thermoleophilaceae bacterium]